MVIGVPEGDSVIMIQIKSKTKDFYPKLYFKFYVDIESQMRDGLVEFPPNGSPGFTSFKKWDYNMNLLSYTFQERLVTGTKAGLAITIFDSQMARSAKEKAEVMITVSYSPEQKLTLKNTVVGSLYY